MFQNKENELINLTSGTLYMRDAITMMVNNAGALRKQTRTKHSPFSTTFTTITMRQQFFPLVDIGHVCTDMSINKTHTRS